MKEIFGWILLTPVVVYMLTPLVVGMFEYRNEENMEKATGVIVVILVCAWWAVYFLK